MPVDPNKKVSVDDVVKFPITMHPVLFNPSEQLVGEMVKQKGVEFTYKALVNREDRIRASLMEPYNWGFESPHWKDADEMLNDKNELLVLGGNRSGKSEFCGKRVAQAFIGIDLCSGDYPQGEHEFPEWLKKKVRFRGLKIWCLHTTNQSSIAFQQNLVYKYIPSKLKEAKKGKFTNIGYSQKNGFSDNTAVYDQNQIWFLNYAQDKKVIEGGEPDIIWCDELIPHDWLETLRYRTITRNAHLILTFTPITGYSMVVKDYVQGCRFSDFKESELVPNSQIMGCPKGQMPYKAKAAGDKANIIWFHSNLNVFSPYENIVKQCKGKSTADVKIRAYGWADNMGNAQFPNFGDACIVAPSDIPLNGTDYHVVDPAGARNWFQLWGRVVDNGDIYIYREWPDDSYGEWSLPSDKADGKAGPAQKIGAGMGIDDYSSLIAGLEKWSDPTAPSFKANSTKVYERYMDSRSAGNEQITKDGGITLVELLAGAKYPLQFYPAVDLHIEQRVLRINNRFSHDKNAPISSENKPTMFISSDCKNLIYSLREWTGEDGQKGASKDPIDCLGYLISMEPSFISDKRNPEWEKLSKPASY